METNNLKLPLLKPNDTGKEFIVNEAFKLIDDFSVIKNGVSIDGSNATFNNLSVIAKQNIINIAMPDYSRREIIVNPLMNTNYIRDYNSYVGVRISSPTTGYSGLYINDVVQDWMQDGSNSNSGDSFFIPLPANNSIRVVDISGWVSIQNLTFYKIKGDN